MVIQVTTTHGKPFWCADIRFGPRPMRLWFGDGEPPDTEMRTISATQVAHMERFTGDHGPLFIEKDPTFSRQADDLMAEYAAVRDELAQVGQRAANLAEQNEGLRGQVAGLEAHVAELKATLAATEKRASQAEARAKQLARSRSKGK